METGGKRGGGAVPGRPGLPGPAGPPGPGPRNSVASHLHGAGYALGRGEDARTHVVGRNRRAAHARDKGRRDSRINRQPRPMHGDGAIDDICGAQDDRAPIHGHEVGP